MSGTKVLISQLDISMGQSMGLSFSQQDNSICSQQGMVQFSTENSGVAVINPIRKIESVDMIDLRIWQIYNKFLQKFQVFYFNSKVGVWPVVILAVPSSSSV
jgi:hypothetical protein|tara:strand:+ start:8220 stop:8525 length:306 start_codon:yes stop_codon:yes gene_type:complete